MMCLRCGEAESATEHVFVVSHEHNPDLDSAIDAALKRNGIDGVSGLGQLCEGCWSVAHTAIDAGARSYWATRRDIIQKNSETNLGRPLTSAERAEIDAYFDGADEGARSSAT
jgi:hypothetical protein